MRSIYFNRHFTYNNNNVEANNIFATITSSCKGFAKNSTSYQGCLMSKKYWYGFNSYENDNEIKGIGNSIDFWARVYDSRLGRFQSPDPKTSVFPDLLQYSFAANWLIMLIDKNGLEPARNQAGTIQDATKQWKDAKLTTMDEIRNFVTTKRKDVMSIRYVYMEKQGWIDLQHYFGVQEYGKSALDLLEPASGNGVMQFLFFGNGADKSYYSYEDLPTNTFAYGAPLYDLKSFIGIPYKVEKTGEDLFTSIENHFESAGTTTPQNAPNYLKIPLDDQDRSRLPEIKETIYINPSGDSMPVKVDIPYSEAEKEQLMKSGKYVPQNHSSTPVNLYDFPAAPTSIEKTKL